MEIGIKGAIFGRIEGRSEDYGECHFKNVFRKKQPKTCQEKNTKF